MSQDIFDNFFRNVLGLPGSDPRVHGARSTGRCCSPTPRSTAGPAHFSALLQEFRSGAKEYKGVTSSILRRKVARETLDLRLCIRAVATLFTSKSRSGSLNEPMNRNSLRGSSAR